MKRLILLPSLVLAFVLASGCMTQEQQYSSMAEKQIRHCDKLLAYNKQRNAPLAASLYTSLLRKIPQRPQFYAVHRRVLLKRGEVHHLLGEKGKAEADFKLAAKIASRMNAPAGPARQPSEVAAPGRTAESNAPERPLGPGAGQAAKPVPRSGAERTEIFSSRIDLWGSVFSNWRIVRDNPSGDGTKIHPRSDLGSDAFTIYGLLRNEIKLFPRLSAALDLGLGTLSGEETVGEFEKYDGCVFPYGQDLEMKASFLEITGLLRFSPKLPIPGSASVEFGAKYTMFTLDLDFEGGMGLTDVIDAFFPVLGVNYSLNLARGLRLLLDLRLCGFYYSENDFKVYTTYIEFFGGCELKIGPHIFAWGGLRYAYSNYELYRDGEEKELTYSQTGPAIGLTLKV